MNGTDRTRRARTLAEIASIVKLTPRPLRHYALVGILPGIMRLYQGKRLTLMTDATDAELQEWRKSLSAKDNAQEETQ